MTGPMTGPQPVPAVTTGPQPVAAAPRTGRAALLITGVALAQLLLLAAITATTGLHLFALPFAASAAIVALAPAAPFAQPKGILVGHLTATVLALAVTAAAGPSVWAAAVAAGLSLAPMVLLKAPHPPAVATAALVGLTAPEPLFLLNPVLAGSLVVIAAGWVLTKATGQWR
ncbi:HPP family protein [Nonomuraea sp. NPDC050310]|uniref:HPP family protein n=1 Tax=Nonomuraea sp. NPDC050310 TaxID=3154935 RepID=UPI0033F53076